MSIRGFLALALVGPGLLLGGCAGPAQPSSAPPGFARGVDLAHVITEDMPRPPAAPPTRIRRGPDGAEVLSVELGVLSGTVLRVVAGSGQAPTVDQLSPRDLVLPAVVLDVRDAAQDTPGYRLSRADLLAWEQRHGRIPAASMVLVVTGWDVRWGDAAAYFNLDGRQVPQVPGLSAAAARLLFAERRVRGLGIDGPAVQIDGAPVDDPAMLSGADYLLVLENLTNLEQLPPTGAQMLIGALKIQASAGSPARVLALLP